MTSERISVLAVEDEAVIAMDLEDMLEDLGYDVIGPASGVDAALALLRSSEPDLAVVDVNLGEETALPIVEALRTAEIPYILTTGYETPELENLGLEGPLVRKPYSAQDLATALEGIKVPLPGRGAST